MKKLFFLLSSLILFNDLVISQTNQFNTVPDGIIFQAIAKSINGDPASGRNIYVDVNIIKETVNGNSIFQERHKVTAGQDGVFTITIGKGTHESGFSSLSDIDWKQNFYFINIKIAIEPTVPLGWDVNSNFNDLGTSQLWTVPYAFYANKSNISNASYSLVDILRSESGGTGVANPVGKTINLGQSLSIKGAGDFTITTTGSSNITFPNSGTMASLDGVEVFTNKTLYSPVLTGRPIGPTAQFIDSSNQLATTEFVKTGLHIFDSLKFNTVDTSLLLQKKDTITFSDRIDLKANQTDVRAALDLKFNTIDTARLFQKSDGSLLSDRINQKFNTSDTSFLLQKKDTITLSDRIDLKLNIGDTLSMLTNRISRDTSFLLQKKDTITLSNRIDLKLNIGDTLSMLTNRISRDTSFLLQKKDTITLSNRIDECLTSA